MLIVRVIKRAVVPIRTTELLELQLFSFEFLSFFHSFLVVFRDKALKLRSFYSIHRPTWFSFCLLIETDLKHA